MELKPITSILWEAPEVNAFKPPSKFNPAADFSLRTSASPAGVVHQCVQCYQCFPVGDSQCAPDNSDMQISFGREKSLNTFELQCHSVVLWGKPLGRGLSKGQINQVQMRWQGSHLLAWVATSLFLLCFEGRKDYFSNSTSLFSFTEAVVGLDTMAARCWLLRRLRWVCVSLEPAVWGQPV